MPTDLPSPADKLRPDFNRRRFLATAAAASTLAGSLQLASADTVQPVSAAKLVKGKDKRLTVHKQFPASMESPPALLDSAITPASLLFIRNNQQPDDVAHIGGMPLKNWKIEFTGLAGGKTFTLNAADLAELEQVEHAVVLQCCGNGRAQFSQAAQTKGTQWSRGAMGNVRFAGVPIKAIVKKYNLALDDKLRFAAGEGNDEALPGADDFEHSLPVHDVIERGYLATRMNGEPLPAIHGGPVRLVVPGFFATMQIKWLTRLRFEMDESTNHHHAGRYRAPKRPMRPGVKQPYTLANSNPCWRLKVKSVVLSHAPGAKVPANRPTVIRGVAFNDGAVRIDSVEISTDRGASWHRAKLEEATGRYGWQRWSAPVTLAAGKQEVWSRATDAHGRSQPLNGSIHWNPSGYEWNGVEKIPLEVS